MRQFMTPRWIGMPWKRDPHPGFVLGVGELVATVDCDDSPVALVPVVGGDVEAARELADLIARAPRLQSLVEMAAEEWTRLGREDMARLFRRALGKGDS